jgi:hypothetical protein
MDLRTAFSTLGLDQTASVETIRDAYRELVKIWHPDRFPGDPRLQTRADDMMRAINVAYDIALAYATAERPAAGSPGAPASGFGTASDSSRTATTAAGASAAGTAARSTRTATFAPNRFFFQAVIVSGLGLALLAAMAPRSPLAYETRVRLDDVSSAPRLLPLREASVSVQTPSELGTVLEGTWLLEGWLFDFRQGAIYVRGEKLPIGHYDPETGQRVIYREEASGERVSFDVELTATTMQWYTGEGATRHLVHEFRRCAL